MAAGIAPIARVHWQLIGDDSDVRPIMTANWRHPIPPLKRARGAAIVRLPCAR